MDTISAARVVYVLFLAEFFIGPIGCLIGLVLSDAFGLMGLMIAAGSAGWIFGVIWTVVRCIKGLIYELRGEVYPNPGTWLF
ncbi:MAG: hypothetical protein J4F39_18470 [Candidatus Latescibacteria bacterium]|nr:hypothetical protein [Candidatus Latescibacterota bacterium]